MDFLQVVVTVEEGQTADEGHHHQLHSCPGRLGLRVGGDSHHSGVIDTVRGLRTVVMFSPDSEDTHEEGESGDNHLPWLGGAELPVAPEDFPYPTGQHLPV